MTESEAFEILGLSVGADSRAIKRAYHKLLKRHKPDSDPAGFRRIREAFEAASEAEAMRAFLAEHEVADAVTEEDAVQSVPPSESSESAAVVGEGSAPVPTDAEEEPTSEIDPDVVHAALDRDEVRWAFELVMDERWAAAMLGDQSGPLRWATRDVGLRLVLLHRPALDLLMSKYPDAFGPDDAQLVYLLRVSVEWWELASNVPLPVALVAFATRGSVERDPDVRRKLARDLGDWFMRDVEEGLRLLDRIVARGYDIGPFLHGLASEFDAELDAFAKGPPANALRLLTGVTVTLALVAALAVFLLGGFGEGVWNMCLRFVFAVGAALGVLHAEKVVYEALPSLRRGFLTACIEAGMEPSLAALRLSGHPFLCRALQSDEGLELAFCIGRLAQLRDDS